MTKTSYAKGGLALDQGQLLQQNSHNGIMVGIHQLHLVTRSLSSWLGIVSACHLSTLAIS